MPSGLRRTWANQPKQGVTAGSRCSEPVLRTQWRRELPLVLLALPVFRVRHRIVFLTTPMLVERLNNWISHESVLEPVQRMNDEAIRHEA